VAAIASNQVGSIANGALTTPTAITPAASDTVDRSLCGPNGLLVRAITTGTVTTLTVTDPTTTGLGNAGTPAALTCPASGARMTVVPVAAANASGQITLNWSGALTGVTYELYRW
jgi:hypothetical protein